MVIRVAENGAEYEEPPYTEAEDEEFYWRVSHGVVQVAHGSRTIVPQPPRPPKNDPQIDIPERHKEVQSRSSEE